MASQSASVFALPGGDAVESREKPRLLEAVVGFLGDDDVVEDAEA